MLCMADRLGAFDQDNLAEEIDQFTETLLQLPEFKTLDTMNRFCRASAQPTNDSTEFN